MIKEFKDKYQKFRKSYRKMAGNDGFSAYRLFVFFTSYTGQRRIISFFKKTARSLFRKVFGIKVDSVAHYDLWMQQWFPSPETLQDYHQKAQQLEYNPKISIFLTIHNAHHELLNHTIHSVIQQVYENWELILVSENQKSPLLKELLYYGLEKEIRIKLIDTTIIKFEHSVGEYVTFLNQHDQLSPDALYQFVTVLNENKQVEIIYPDEDKIDEIGNYIDPYFKPDWCPDSFLSRNYIGNTVLISKSLLAKTGCLSHQINENVFYDILLRTMEQTECIVHIPLVLYHRRIQPSSVEPNYESKAQSDITALSDALGRREISGTVYSVENIPGVYQIRYEIRKSGKVSIIIPSKNMTTLCNVAVTSIFTLTDYPDFEVILIDNNSDDPEFFKFIKSWEQKEPTRFRHYKDNGAFNFSRLMNFGASHAKGEYFLLLNNDTEVTHADWITAMVEQAQFETTGAVGVKLLYKNNTIQHAGVIIGLGGLAGHAFAGFEHDANGYNNFLKCINNFSAVTAACLMVRKNAFYDVGGFEEKLAVEYNDVDFCLKLMEKGYHNLLLPHVVLFHYESISRGHPHKTRKSYQQHLIDVKFFKDRWKKYIEHDPCYNPHLTRIFTDFRIRIPE